MSGDLDPRHSVNANKQDNEEEQQDLQVEIKHGLTQEDLDNLGLTPEQVNGLTPEELEALVLDHAVTIWNNMPSQRNGLTPNEIFSGTKDPLGHPFLNRCRVWGAPSYVLDPRLQDAGRKIPKFEKR